MARAMARGLRWILPVVLGMMGLMVWQRVQRPMASYTRFVSQHLQVAFDYPQGWRVQEISLPMERVMGEIQIFGPRREDLEYSVYVDVAAEILNAPPQDLKAIVEAELAEKRKGNYTVLEHTPIRCGGQPAIRVLANTTRWLPLRKTHRAPVLFQEVVAYCLHNQRIFRLTYAAPAADFEQHQHAFTRLVERFKFLPSM